MLHDDEKVTYFAQTDSRNRRTPFGIKRKDRSRHMYVIGKTGMGKSTLLENMAIQDIRNGEGMAFIDPHGKTAELLLDYIPEERVKDVLYFAPFDMEYPISFNVMEDVGPDKRHLVVNGLMSTFEKIWVDAWSARMAYILNNTLLALLEYPGSTLLGINRMLSDKEYRKRVVENVKDPSVRSFWVDEFGKYTDKYAAEATPAIQNKVGQFTSNPLIRNIIGQSVSTFNFRAMMDGRKIIIINLSKGRVGEGNANLLGSMLITKMYLAAMSRADATEAALDKLPNFYLYVDEFQSFANKSFADILSEARKYKLNLTITHQYIEQMEEEVRAAVFGNVGTMVTFRVGAYDAEVLEKEFAPQFTVEDLVNLGIYQVYLKLMIDGVGSAPFSATTLPPIEPTAPSLRQSIIDSSRQTFGAPRLKVEETIKAWHQPLIPIVHKQADKTVLKKEGSAPGQMPARSPIISKPVYPPVYPKPQHSNSPATPVFEALRPAPKVSPPAPVASSISLAQLKPNDPIKKTQARGQENLADLRKALSTLLKDKEAGKSPSPAPGGEEAKRTQPKESRPAQSPQHFERPKPKEIPEEVLRNLLKVDKDDRS
ncbi:MAG: type IV secretion system DNA-binding domain-containing protein [Candidatus Taylorbacteria bacterium]|nr:type IV secretion system DNA-binding domain-containing protein [Candidatus Taylorbacteria bacterium]